jgi:hypothetical protein
MENAIAVSLKIGARRIQGFFMQAAIGLGAMLGIRGEDTGFVFFQSVPGHKKKMAVIPRGARGNCVE